MSLYNMLFGQNPNTEIVLALLGVKECDVERFRDCGIDFEKKLIHIYARTGGGNREDYPQTALTQNPLFINDCDGDFDNTYATFYFKFPDEIKEEIACLSNPLELGYPAKLTQFISKTINREPTEGDKSRTAYKEQMQVISQLKAQQDILIWNGHTVVPLSDGAMERILQVCEKNNGEFTAYWYVKPYQIDVQQNIAKWSFGQQKPEIEQDMARVKIDSIGSGGWKIDEWWQQRWIDKFGEKYPLSVEKLLQN